MRRIKKTTKQYIIVGIISLFVVLAAFLLAYLLGIKQVENKYKTSLNQATTEISNHKKKIYVAKKSIRAGETITKSNVVVKELYTSMNVKNHITKTDIGKIALVDIKKDDYIFHSMLTEEKFDVDLRENEFNMLYLSKNLKESDFVDIRLLFPNGEDYVVVSKKSLKNLDLINNICYFWLNEEETLYLSSAIIDAYLHEGAKLYTAKYIQSQLQSPTAVTYEPSENVMDLIQRDPNISEIAARELSKKVRQDMDKRLKEIEGQAVIQWERNEINQDALDQSNHGNEEESTLTEETISDSNQDETKKDEGSVYVD